jgi:ketosteroid isomerase-like protein
MTHELEVLRAANALIGHFGSGEVEAYFAAFAPQASFIFHQHPDRLMSLEAYRQCWRDWERETGFRVIACQSSGQVVRMLGDTALFMHDVRTETETNTGRSIAYERESILFRQEPDGRWLAWHEHLSPAA